jgi:phosphoglycolate phosphatase-like HAD superfamily hydrolase
MSTNKFESLLELLINEENDKAEALFHEIVVEKSRDIYENLADEEVTAEAKEESKDEEVKETEESKEDKVEETAEESKEDDKVEETSEESKDEQVDEVVELEDEATKKKARWMLTTVKRCQRTTPRTKAKKIWKTELLT